MYDYEIKLIGKRVSKKSKGSDNDQEMVTEDVIMINNIVIDPIAIAFTGIDLMQTTKGNVISMTKTIIDLEIQIKALQKELAKLRSQKDTSSSSNVEIESFKESVLKLEDDTLQSQIALNLKIWEL